MPGLYDFCTALRVALKVKFSWLIFGFLLLVVLVMLLASYFSGRQPSTVALDVGFSTARLLLPLLVVLLVQELLSHEFDKRYYLSSLTYPRSRSCFLLGRFVAVQVLVLCVLLLFCLLQICLMQFFENIYPQATPVVMGQSYLVVIAFFALDLLVLTSLAVLLAVVASTPTFVLIGTFGFMLVARSYGAIVDLLGRGGGEIGNAEGYRAGLGALGYLLPDLGALDVRMLALYGKPEFLPVDWPWLVLSSLGYAGALLALAIWALQRKRFS